MDSSAPLAQAAAAVLQRNDRGAYSVPTQGLYPMQFNWDSAIASLGYRWLAPARAWDEIETLVAAQQPDGRIPHIVFRGDYGDYFPGPAVWQCGSEQLPVSGLANPPVLAFAVRRLLQSKTTIEPTRLNSILAALAKSHCWFMQCRVHEPSGAVLIVHPWESGRDNLSDWDAAMARVKPRSMEPYERSDLKHVAAEQRPTSLDYDRFIEIVACGVDLKWDQKKLGQQSPFLMVDVGMTAILLRASLDLDAMLADAQMDAELEATAGISDKLAAALAFLWNDEIGAYTSYDPIAQQHVNAVSAASFLAPFAGVASGDKHQRLMEHFDRFSAGKLPVASFDPEHELFDAKRYWRGPVWMPVNLLIEIGLATCDEKQRAEQIRQGSLEIMQREGMREYYDPAESCGLGGDMFTWSAAAALDWINVER